MNSFGIPSPQGGDPRWERFSQVLARDPRFKPGTLPHCARWVSGWRRAGGDESAEATRAHFEALGRRPRLADRQLRQAIQIPERADGMGLAMGLSRRGPLRASANKEIRPLPSARKIAAEAVQASAQKNGHRQTSHLPLAPA